MISSFKVKYKNKIFELALRLNDLYWIMHVMQRKLQKIIQNMSGKQCKSVMKMFQKEEFGGLKGDQYEVFLWLFTINVFS